MRMLPSFSVPLPSYAYFIFFFFNDTATTEIYTLSLHDALPIFALPVAALPLVTVGTAVAFGVGVAGGVASGRRRDRKSTRLNSSHSQISYAVFCLKKKNLFCSSSDTQVSVERIVGI